VSISTVTTAPAGARADFEHRVRLIELGRANNEVEQVEVNEEVLAEFAPGLEPVGLEETAKVRESLAR
jgi:hypothetical protein